MSNMSNNQPIPIESALQAHQRKERMNNQTEESLRLLVDSVKDYAIFMLNPSGIIVSWNQGAERLKGYSADEIIGKHFSIFYTPEAIESNHPQFELEEATKNGRYEEEGWRVRKDGSLVWVNVVITPLYDKGKLVGFGKVTRDLTERRDSEAERESALKSERIFRLMVSGVRDYAIFVLDPQGHILTWNEGAQRAKGYTEKEIVGKHFSIFYTQDAKDSRHPDKELEIAKETGRYEEEGWRVRKDGTRFWANVVITALYEDGELIGFAKVTRDLTERKLSEQQRERQSKAINETNEELQRLAYVVSHELQAPIGTISRYCNLLSIRYKDKLGSDANEFIDKMSSSSKLVARMIDDLWTYARISKPNFQKEDFSTEEAVTEAVASLGDAAKASVITHGILPTINGNKAHFVHMFKELISNGIKYNNNATPQIHIDAHRQDDGWAFTVKDNGIGIDKVYARDVFKMFQRINGEPESSATGMGLTIAKKIVTQHYGRIWFDSDFGLGTTFTIWIPG